MSDVPDDRPPLPPRPRPSSSLSTVQARPTTAITPLDIQTLSFPDGSRGTFVTPMLGDLAIPPPRATRSSSSAGYATPSPRGGGGSEIDDAASVRSHVPMRPSGDIASLLVGDMSGRRPNSAAWSMLKTQSPTVQPFESIRLDADCDLAAFSTEFDALPDESSPDYSDEDRLALWKSKLKHYMILSAAGKPIYSRHGDLGLINSSMGVIQTIISFYEAAGTPLVGFTAGNTRFVILTHGPLYLVGISKLGESDAQLRAQLDALYMQILSTLTLPALTRIFANRPSTDLSAPLHGTEPLLSSLADTFTRGSASALLGAIECLRLRKSQRLAINNTLLKLRSEKLLYGMLAADGRLVSVVRPRRHSLHPSDLQLIFNMLFESGGIKAGGGENWIPLCLPSFNNTGYLYMYVSFLSENEESESGSSMHDAQSIHTNATNDDDVAVNGTDANDNDTNDNDVNDNDTNDNTKSTRGVPPQIAMILISADRESFFDLKQMRDAVAQSLSRSGHLATIITAARFGRPRVSDIAPSSQLSHFLFKSRDYIQLVAAATDDHDHFNLKNDDDFKDDDEHHPHPFASPLARRRLMSLYHSLHTAVHAKHTHLRVVHCVSEAATALAWVTRSFELYCVAGPNVSRAAMTQGANRVIQWARREEERLFIIGGGVF